MTHSTSAASSHYRSLPPLPPLTTIPTLLHDIPTSEESVCCSHLHHSPTPTTLAPKPQKTQPSRSQVPTANLIPSSSSSYSSNTPHALFNPPLNLSLHDPNPLTDNYQQTSIASSHVPATGQFLFCEGICRNMPPQFTGPLLTIFQQQLRVPLRSDNTVDLATAINLDILQYLAPLNQASTLLHMAPSPQYNFGLTHGPSSRLYLRLIPWGSPTRTNLELPSSQPSHPTWTASTIPS